MAVWDDIWQGLKNTPTTAANIVNAFIPGTEANRALTQQGPNSPNIAGPLIPLDPQNPFNVSGGMPQGTGRPPPVSVPNPAAQDDGTGTTLEQFAFPEAPSVPRVTAPEIGGPPDQRAFIETLDAAQEAMLAPIQQQLSTALEEIARREQRGNQALDMLGPRVQQTAQQGLQNLAGITEASGQSASQAGPVALSDISLTGMEGAAPFAGGIVADETARQQDIPLLRLAAQQDVGAQRTLAQIAGLEAASEATKFVQQGRIDLALETLRQGEQNRRLEAELGLRAQEGEADRAARLQETLFGERAGLARDIAGAREAARLEEGANQPSEFPGGDVSYARADQITRDGASRIWARNGGGQSGLSQEARNIVKDIRAREKDPELQNLAVEQALQEWAANKGTNEAVLVGNIALKGDF